MRKLLYIILFILLAVVVVEITLLYRANKSQKIGNIYIKTQSQQDNLELRIKDKEALETYLLEKGILDRIMASGVMNFEDKQINFTEKIKIILTNEEQPVLKIVTPTDGGERTVLRGFWGAYDEDSETYELFLYINPKLSELSGGGASVNTIVSSYFVEGLFIISNGDLEPDKLSEELIKIQQEVVNNKFEFIELGKKKTALFIGKFRPIKTVMAQSCTGTGTQCFVNEWWLECSSNGSGCSTYGADCNCYYDIFLKRWECLGTCVYVKDCVWAFNRECRVSGTSCYAPGCGIDTCETRYGSCYWTCGCGSWVNGACGGGSCPSNERLQTRTCSPPGCAAESRCVDDAACAATPTPTPSCTASLDPSTVSVAIGTNANYIATVTIGAGIVGQVNFSSSNTAVSTVNPASDTTQPYQTVGETLAVGSSTITSNVIMGGAQRCTDTAILNVTAPGPWWQVIDADVITSGDIISSIPSSCALPGCNPLFGLEGLGGYPGVPIYGGSTANFGEGGVSSTGWLANTQSLFSKIYDYNFFRKMVRSDVEVSLTEIEQASVNGGFFTSGGAPSRGYVWYHFDGNTWGDLTISNSINMPGTRKVVVLVENADLYINDRINVVDGTGFIMFIVGKDDSGNKGNISIDANVSHPVAVEIEGVFLSEGQFRTGAGSNQLHVRGMVAAYGGVVLERDLLGDNADEPAEVFEFAPDFVLTFPRDLTFKRLRWKEVAP
ncbi:hypothetical protein KKH23_01775 [Patescibacteria group bacterium]|nr:hypothetical protein [Patescibacteria group bacterium]MBU0777217.1 hypothetical protein [Patescibacteria group bacterium]MBU0845912.1 hypothetical protein [Patescibacteria group bacterium]MBU0922939.1 hypothetical protein [Patescibacteria group bacterium]MBU1066216.1 hypothetical protein [Patescibacteria group bacterium]